MGCGSERGWHSRIKSATSGRWIVSTVICFNIRIELSFCVAAAGPSNRNKPFRVDVRGSLEGTDSPGRLRSSRSKRSFGIFRIEKMSEKGFAGSSRTIIGGNKSIGISESPATI
jgi:hypothetical protein